MQRNATAKRPPSPVSIDASAYRGFNGRGDDGGPRGTADATTEGEDMEVENTATEATEAVGMTTGFNGFATARSYFEIEFSTIPEENLGRSLWSIFLVRSS